MMLLSRLGLDRPELRAWAYYDWANSAFMTTIIAAVFPIYYASVAAKGIDPGQATFWFSIATTGALAFVAVTAPVLGALADTAAMKKPLLMAFQSIGVLSCFAMVFITEGRWQLALGLFVLGNIGVSGAFTFYDSLLPHIARPEELDRVSSAGYALGYLGGGLLLAVNLAWIQKPEWFGMADAGVAARVSFASVGVWWLAFSIPLFRRVPEPPASGRPHGMRSLVAGSFVQLGGTLRELRRFRQAFLMLLAFLVYNDGINTIIRMASIYGTAVGIAQQHLILALLLVQFVGIPFSFLFGRLAGLIGAKRSVFVALVVYTGISVLGFFMRTRLHFYALACLVATVQGAADFEKSTLVEITNARASVSSIKATPELINDPEAFAKFQAAQAQMTSALSRLLAVAENYPQLTATKEFGELRAELAGAENRISVARGRYIKAVQAYNVLAREFPTNLTAMVFGYKTKANFSVENEKAIAAPPKVDFTKPAAK